MKNVIAIIFALPIIQIINLMKHAGTQNTKSARIGTFVVFIPVIVLTTTLWGFVWLFLIHIAFGIG